MNPPPGELLGQGGVVGAVLLFFWYFLRFGINEWRKENQERRTHETDQTIKTLEAQEKREQAHQEAVARREEIVEQRLTALNEEKRLDRDAFTQATAAFQEATAAFRDALQRVSHD